MEIEIKSVEDLYQLKYLENNGIKLNRSALARKLNVDRRTVEKYINGYKKSTTRNKPSQFDQYHHVIEEILHNKKISFSYKRELYQYLVDHYGMEGAESSFRRHILLKKEFNKYFVTKKSKKKSKK